MPMLHTRIPSRFRALTASVLALFLAGCSDTSLEGKFQDKSGTTFEFIAGGTAVVKTQREQFVLSWERLENNRLKFIPGPDAGTKTQICNYSFQNPNTLYLSGCDITKNVTLTRL